MSRHYLMPSLFALAFAVSAHAETVTLSSPDGRNVVTVDSDRLTYAINRDGKTVIDPSPLGLNLDIGQIGAGATYTKHIGNSVDTTWNLVVGKTATAPDHYTQSDLAFTSAKGLKFNLIVRAYDEGGVPLRRAGAGGRDRFQGDERKHPVQLPEGLRLLGRQYGPLRYQFRSRIRSDQSVEDSQFQQLHGPAGLQDR
jgi:hypothetical protein